MFKKNSKTPHTRTNADSPSFKMHQERENKGSSVNPCPHFPTGSSRLPGRAKGAWIQKSWGAREGLALPAERAGSPGSPSRRFPCPPTRPGPGRSPAGDPGSCVFEDPQPLRCFRRRAPQTLLGPAHSSKSPANPGAPGPSRNLLLCPQPLLEIRSAWAPTGRRPSPTYGPPHPAPGP